MVQTSTRRRFRDKASAATVDAPTPIASPPRPRRVLEIHGLRAPMFTGSYSDGLASLTITDAGDCALLQVNIYSMRLTPGEARALAQWLTLVADRVDKTALRSEESEPSANSERD